MDCIKVDTTGRYAPKSKPAPSIGAVELRRGRTLARDDSEEIKVTLGTLKRWNRTALRTGVVCSITGIALGLGTAVTLQLWDWSWFTFPGGLVLGILLGAGATGVLMRWALAGK